MKKVTVIVGEQNWVEGVNLNTTLKSVREQLQKRGYTEVNTIYRAGKHEVTFLTETVGRDILIQAGLVKETKAEKSKRLSKQQ